MQLNQRAAGLPSPFKSTIKPCLLLAMLLLVGSAQAEIYKCIGASGAAEFSDQPCKAGNSSTVLPDNAPLTEQQKSDAQKRAQQMDKKADELEHQREMAEKNQPPPPPPQTPPAEVVDEGATGSCNDPRRLNSNCAPTPHNRGDRLRRAR